MSAVLTTAGRKLALALSACFLAVSSSFAQDASPLEVTNTAIATFIGPTEESGGEESRITATSNTVVAPINVAPPELTIYNDPEHTNAPAAVGTVAETEATPKRKRKAKPKAPAGPPGGIAQMSTGGISARVGD